MICAGPLCNEALPNLTLPSALLATDSSIESTLPVYSLVSGVKTEYIVAGGKPTIRLKSTGRLSQRGAYIGTAALYFHWVRHDKSESWEFNPSIPEPQPIQPEETTDSNGDQLLTFTLGELLPAAGLLRGRWEGTILAPAIHLDIPLGRDMWIFLIRSPWFPLKLTPRKQSLTLPSEKSIATATLSPGPAGALSTMVSNPEGSFKKVSLIMKRRIGELVSEELIGEIGTGQVNLVWKPITRNFDLCLQATSSMSERELSDIVRGLGAESSQGLFGPGSLDGDYILCDGPLTEYWLTLKGDRGFFSHLEDSTQLDLTW